MSVKLFETKQVQDFLNIVCGLDNDGGNPRAKAIMHRILSDLYKTIEDFDVTPDEFWAAVGMINTLGQHFEAALLSPGLGFDHYLDLRMDAADNDLNILKDETTPRTIEGPLYVAGAPVEQGYARLDDGSDVEHSDTYICYGVVEDHEGNPIPGAKVEVWHANSKGWYSHYDPTGEQKPFNMRRSIITDENGRYKYRSTLPAGYGCPPDGPTQQVLNLLGRHGNRPAHIHYFVTADGHRKLTTQINIEGDPYIWDDFAFATREGLVPKLVEVTDEARIKEEGTDGPFKEMEFNIRLTPLVDGEDNQVVNRWRKVGTDDL